MLSNDTGSRYDPIRENRRSVIIVDDEVLLANALAERLSVEGIATEVASDMSQGLALCANRKFDAAFIDFKLPDGEGTSLAAFCKERYPSMFVILMTGFASSADDPNLLAGAVDSVLPKPWNPGELRGILKSILEKAE